MSSCRPQPKAAATATAPPAAISDRTARRTPTANTTAMAARGDVGNDDESEGEEGTMEEYMWPGVGVRSAPTAPVPKSPSPVPQLPTANSHDDKSSSSARPLPPIADQPTMAQLPPIPDADGAPRRRQASRQLAAILCSKLHIVGGR